MREGDPAFRALREAIEAVAADDAPDLIAEARAEARAKVRTILADAMAEALLERAGGALAPDRLPPQPAPAPARATTGTDPSVAQEAWYVFGVVREDALEAPAGTELITAGGLAAVARPVPLAEYGEEALRENLNDIAWLEDAARRHEHVLATLLRETTVIPLRLCTIYRSEGAVRDMLAAEAAGLGEALDRLAGRTEWGVKAFCDAAQLSEEDGAGEGGRGAGEAYMERRRREAGARRRATELVDAAVEEAHARLATLAEEALANPLQRRELTGRDDDMVLNGVYLVDDEQEAGFRAAVEELEAPGITFELTGPWPPYNFVKRSVDAAR